MGILLRAMAIDWLNEIAMRLPVAFPDHEEKTINYLIFTSLFKTETIQLNCSFSDRFVLWLSLYLKQEKLLLITNNIEKEKIFRLTGRPHRCSSLWMDDLWRVASVIRSLIALLSISFLLIQYMFSCLKKIGRKRFLVETSCNVKRNKDFDSLIGH